MAKNPITIEVLETLDAIERRGTFAKAAEELDKATSAISYTIQKLEEQLEVTLFQRQGRNSVLTNAGRVLLNEGREILTSARRLAEKTQEVANGWEPRITIAIESLQPFDQFFSAIASFLDHHPNIELDIQESVLNGGWDALEQKRVDLIVGSPGPVPAKRGFRAVKLKAPKLVPVVSAKHPLADKQMNKTQFVLLDQARTIFIHDTTQSLVARSAGIEHEGKRLYVQNIDQKVAAIKAGIGIGHLPLERIKPDLANGSLVKVELQSTEKTVHYMAWNLTNKGQGLHALTKLLSKRLGTS